MNIISLLFSTLVFFPAQPDIFLEVVSHAENHDVAILAPHENEHVVNQYVAEQIIKHGGTLVVLRQAGERNIKLTIGDQSVSIDPNRLFSDRGIRRSISRLNPDLASDSVVFLQSVDRARALAELIIRTLNAEQAHSWIAIHNNTQGYSGDDKDGVGTISIKRYQKKLASGAKYLIKVHDSGKDEDDLFFITEPEDFETMVKAGWNVVLQNPAVATDPNEDDGSLSVLAEKVHKRYINIEAERADGDFGRDSFENQKRMVDLVFDILFNNQVPAN